MTTAEKAEKVFQSGLGFRIWNKPVKDPNTEENLWDIRIFWTDTFLSTHNSEYHCPKDGFKDIDDCLDDMLKQLDDHE